MAIRAVILDFDGLILDTESPMRASWTEIFEQHGLVVPEEQWALLLGASADPPEAYELLEQHLDVPVDRRSLHSQRMARELKLLEFEALLPGVRELVEDARSAGLGLAVASSSERAWVEGLLEKHNLIEPFDAIVCAEDVAQTKPAPDLFLKALDLLGVEPKEAIAFEDSLHGVAAAKAAGIFCIAVPNPVTQCLDFSTADLRIDSIASHGLQHYIDAALRNSLS